MRSLNQERFIELRIDDAALVVFY